MTELWNYVSEDDETISLHDCLIDRTEIRGADRILHLSDGLDVCRENRFNPTGRHRRSGPAAVILEGAGYLGGAYLDAKDGEKKMAEESLWNDLANGWTIEVLAFTWDRSSRRFSIEADLWPNGSGRAAYIQFEFACDRVLFCWNELSGDAWFQE